MNTPMDKLLILLKEEYLSDNRFPGLCSATTSLYNTDKITSIQYHRLRGFININRPSEYTYYKYNGYFWPISERESRIDWLDKHIKLEYVPDKS